MNNTTEKVRIAAVADIHCTKTSQGILQPFFSGIAQNADVLLLCGDNTDTGLPEEARILVKELAAIKIPVVGVLGNHDYESDKQDEVNQILCDAGVTMLNGDDCQIHGVGFVGVKGFAGGFGQQTLQSWGESTIKSFVKAAVDEALRLEAGLSRLQTHPCLALLHYAPIRATVQGENPEIFAYLGCSRLEEPLNRFHVSAIFHGHAHNGTPEGQTKSGIPVYNVSMPLLKKTFPDRPPFRIVEIPLEPDSSKRGGESGEPV